MEKSESLGPDEARDKLGGTSSRLIPSSQVTLSKTGKQPAGDLTFQCFLCRQGKEDIAHLLTCPAYSHHREKLLATVKRSYSRGNNGANILEAEHDRLIEVLLGANAGCKLTEDEVDRALKRYLRKNEE